MRFSRTVTAGALAAILLMFAATAAASAAPLPKANYLVGAATRSINPDPDGTFAGKPVYLGGYGIGGGSPVFEGRPATGILGDGLSVRAFAVSDGQLAVRDRRHRGPGLVRRHEERALRAARHAQGGRAAHGRGAAGRERRDPERPQPLGPGPARRLGRRARRVPPLRRRPHRGGDRRRVLVDGARRASTTERRPAATCCRTSSTTTRRTRSSTRTCACCRRAAKSKKPLVTLLNFSAHATVLGSSNTKASGDWVQAANPLLEQRFGGKAVTVVGTLGRTQPADRGCADPAATTERRAEPLQDPRLRGARGRPRRAGRRQRAADRAASRSSRALLSGRGPDLERADPRPRVRRQRRRRPAQPGDDAALADRERARHRDGDRPDRRRAAVGGPRRDVSADRARRWRDSCRRGAT